MGHGLIGPFYKAAHAPRDGDRKERNDSRRRCVDIRGGQLIDCCPDSERSPARKQIAHFDQEMIRHVS